MASIVERNNSVSVVYYYQDEDGNKKQKWETVKKDQLDRSEIEAATGKRVKERLERQSVLLLVVERLKWSIHRTREPLLFPRRLL